MKSPFKFLDSYTKEDREIFFGREREIEELYHRVFESMIMLVYGVSGTGKSSLINCGLANKFSETDWLPLNIRRGGNILESLAAAIKTASITKQTGEIVTPSQFKKFVRSLYLDHYKPVFFIFDQFEELFIFGNKEEKKAVVQVIKALVESEIQCRFIFVMREEYMAGVTEFEKVIPTIFANRVRIEKMAHINAIEAIKGPCKVANINLEEGFAEALLEKLSPESADVELTYLQVFLDRILRLASNSPFEGGQGGCSFTIPLLSKVGNVSDLLGVFLDEQISFLDDPDTGLAVLKSFVSIKGTKKQMSNEEVSEYAQTLGKPIDGSKLQEMLQIFIHLRILRDKDQNEKYELRHDALATKIYEKITLVEKEILEIRQFIENANNSYLKRGVLISADDLNYIAPYENRLFLSKELSLLVEKSKFELIKTRKRNRRIIISAVIFLILILSTLSIWALNERRNAVAQERIAVDAKNQAIESENAALNAKNQAVESEKKATSAKEIAEKELYQSVINTWTVTPGLMNVLYIGIENPVTITASGVKSDKIFATVNNGTIRKVGVDFIIKPERYGNCVISAKGISTKGDTLDLGKREFRTKYVPPPGAKVKGLSGGIIDKDLLASADKIDFSFNFDFNYDTSLFKISTFTLSVYYKGLYFSKSSNSNHFNQDQKTLIRQVGNNQTIYIEDIKATSPWWKVIDLPALVFKVKDPVVEKQKSDLISQYLDLLNINQRSDTAFNSLRVKLYKQNDEQFYITLIDSMNKSLYRYFIKKGKTIDSEFSDKEILILHEKMDIENHIDLLNKRKSQEMTTLPFDFQCLSKNYFENQMIDSAIYFQKIACSLDTNKSTYLILKMYEFYHANLDIPATLDYNLLKIESKEYFLMYQDVLYKTYNIIENSPAIRQKTSMDILNTIRDRTDYDFANKFHSVYSNGKWAQYGYLISFLADSTNFEALYFLFKLKPENYVKKKLADNLNRIYSESSFERTWDAYRFLQERNRYQPLDTISIELNLPPYQIKYSEKLLEISTSDNHVINQIGKDCSDLSWNFIIARQFKNSLKACKIAIKADSTYQYSYTNLPLALLFNNEYENAINEYKKWKDRPWTSSGQFRTFREVFLADIADLEKRGIVHPDFAKVKELLKK